MLRHGGARGFVREETVFDHRIGARGGGGIRERSGGQHHRAHDLQVRGGPRRGCRVRPGGHARGGVPGSRPNHQDAARELVLLGGRRRRHRRRRRDPGAVGLEAPRVRRRGAAHRRPRDGVLPGRVPHVAGGCRARIGGEAGTGSDLRGEHGVPAAGGTPYRGGEGGGRGRDDGRRGEGRRVGGRGSRGGVGVV